MGQLDWASIAHTPCSVAAHARRRRAVQTPPCTPSRDARSPCFAAVPLPALPEGTDSSCCAPPPSPCLSCRYTAARSRASATRPGA